MAVSAVEGIDASRGGGSFRLPRSNYGTSRVYHATLRLWAVPVLATKLSNQGEIYDLIACSYFSFTSRAVVESDDMTSRSLSCALTVWDLGLSFQTTSDIILKYYMLAVLYSQG